MFKIIIEKTGSEKLVIEPSSNYIFSSFDVVDNDLSNLLKSLDERTFSQMTPVGLYKFINNQMPDVRLREVFPSDIVVDRDFTIVINITDKLIITLISDITDPCSQHELSFNSSNIWIHKKTGNPYTIVTPNFIHKKDGEWIRNLILYHTEYYNPDGEYFSREPEDFYTSFEIKK